MLLLCVWYFTELSLSSLSFKALIVDTVGSTTVLDVNISLGMFFSGGVAKQELRTTLQRGNGGSSYHLYLRRKAAVGWCGPQCDSCLYWWRACVFVADADNHDVV